MTFPDKWISVPAAEGGHFDAYLVLPPAGSGPGLVLFQEIFGVNAHIRAVAEDFAARGYVVLAPDLFWRQQRRVELDYEGADRARALELMAGLKAAELDADVVASVSALRAMSVTAGHGVGAIGYCLGGRLAFFAAALTDVDAAVSYYGGGIQDRLDRVPNVKCPMQFHYAENDHGIPLTSVAAVEQAFSAKPAEFHVYAGAQHGFNCDDRGAFHPQAATSSRQRTLSFLQSTLWSVRR